jgi:glutathione S-transferase
MPRRGTSANATLALEHCSASLNASSFTEATLLIESTHGCGQTPRLLLLLEEMGAPYELTFRPAGHFLETYGRPGPRLVDNDLTLFECTTMLRHCARTRADGGLVPQSLHELARVDAWLDLSNLLGLTVVTLRREEREQGEERRPARIAEGHAMLAGILAIVERALEDSDGDWLLGDFGLADCAMASVPRLVGLIDFDRWPRVRAYCERLAMRPAVGRVQAKLGARAATETG